MSELSFGADLGVGHDSLSVLSINLINWWLSTNQTLGSCLGVWTERCIVGDGRIQRWLRNISRKEW